MIQAETDAKKTILESKALATKRAQEGYSYREERSFDVAEAVARNEAVGELTNLGVGLGTMAGVGGAVGGVVGDSVNQVMNPVNMNEQETTVNPPVCSECGAVLVPNAKFCMECGHKL